MTFLPSFGVSAFLKLGIFDVFAKFWGTLVQVPDATGAGLATDGAGLDEASQPFGIFFMVGHVQAFVVAAPERDGRMVAQTP